MRRSAASRRNRRRPPRRIVRKESAQAEVGEERPSLRGRSLPPDRRVRPRGVRCRGTHRSRPTNTFDGFTSRCSTPLCVHRIEARRPPRAAASAPGPATTSWTRSAVREVVAVVPAASPRDGWSPSWPGIHHREHTGMVDQRRGDPGLIEGTAPGRQGRRTDPQAPDGDRGRPVGISRSPGRAPVSPSGTSGLRAVDHTRPTATDDLASAGRRPIRRSRCPSGVPAGLARGRTLGSTVAGHGGFGRHSTNGNCEHTPGAGRLGPATTAAARTGRPTAPRTDPRT